MHDDPTSAPQPVSLGRYVLGVTLVLGYHTAACTTAHALGLVRPRWRPVARWHRRYLGDVARSILRRKRR